MFEGDSARPFPGHGVKLPGGIQKRNKNPKKSLTCTHLLK